MIIPICIVKRKYILRDMREQTEIYFGYTYPFSDLSFRRRVLIWILFNECDVMSYMFELMLLALKFAYSLTYTFIRLWSMNVVNINYQICLIGVTLMC